MLDIDIALSFPKIKMCHKNYLRYNTLSNLCNLYNLCNIFLVILVNVSHAQTHLLMRKTHSGSICSIVLYRHLYHITYIKACVEYGHDLFISTTRIFTLPSRCERPENQSSSHTLLFV